MSITTRLLLMLAFLGAVAFGGYRAFFGFWIYRGYQPKAGDVLFQTSQPSRLIETIQGVTGSRVSHCGIVVKSDGGWFVLEAVGPVKETPLNQWVRHGVGNRFSAYRLRDELLDVVPDFVREANRFAGLPYDKRYQLDDEKIYCSELVYKAYTNATGDGLGRLVRLGELRWKPYERSIRYYEKGPVPLEREMITPVGLTEAPQLVMVYSNGL